MYLLATLQSVFLEEDPEMIAKLSGHLQSVKYLSKQHMLTFTLCTRRLCPESREIPIFPYEETRSTKHSVAARPCPSQEGEELEPRGGVWGLSFLSLRWRIGQSTKPLLPLWWDLGRRLGK